MATGTEGQEANVKLGFEYDPKNVEEYIKSLQKIKGDSKETAGNLDGLQSAVQGLGGIIKGAAAAVGGLFVFDQFKEADDLPKRFAHIFSGIETQALRAAKKLKDAFGFSFDDARLKLIEIQEQLITLGLGGETGLKISDQILKRAADVSNELGLDFQKVLSTFQSFVTSGGKDVQGFAEIFKKDKELQKLIFEHSEAVRISGHPTAAQVGLASSFLESASKRFQGSVQRSPGLAFTQRDIKSNAANLFNEVINELLPNMKSFSMVISDLTKNLEKFAPIVADIVKITAILGIGKFGAKGLSKLKGFAPGAAGALGYNLLDLTKGLTGVGAKDAGDFLGDLAYKGTRGVKSFLNPDKSSRFNTTNNITINTPTTDPKKHGEIIGDEIDKRSEKVFRNMNEREIAEQTSSEK